MMKTLKIIFIISSFVCLNTYLNATKPIFLKQQVSNFLHPVVGEKINTKDFNIIIEKMPQEPIEKEDLSDAEIEEILIPSDQRTFEVCLKLGSGNTVNFSGKIEWLANIPTLLKPLGSNDTINLSDITHQMYPVDQLTAMVVMDANELIGKAAAHNIIKPGLPIERSQLKNPTIVKKGEMVNVVYRSQCLIVSAKAQATQDLACGDTGVFETQQNDLKHAKKISAKVVGPSTAEIIHGFA